MLTTAMSKITFRADDDLIDQLEAFEASKSEVLRNSLRHYLENSRVSTVPTDPLVEAESIDAVLAERVDTLIEKRLDQALEERLDQGSENTQDINVNISLDGKLAEGAGISSKRTTSGTASNRIAEEGTEQDSEVEHSVEEMEALTEQSLTEQSLSERSDSTDESEEHQCIHCGDELSKSHIHCPNCGEKATQRSFCECGGELRSDWSFCPACGRRTPAADVLE